MIISEIIGGLGNQLFQYAAGKTLAVRKNTSLNLDVSAFDEYKLRNFDLKAFNTDINIASFEEIKRLKPTSNVGRIQQSILPLSFRRYFKEKSCRFEKNFFKIKPPVYLKGYWQSEKYFINIETLIRKEFILKPEFINRISRFGNQLGSEQSVAVHLRRGDYGNPAVTAYHGILSFDYYKNAISLIKQKIENPRFYFFSDDIETAKETFNDIEGIFVSGLLSKTHYEDFYLMTQCRHNIIANSSFSWWGAWLNANPAKIVVAPEKWFDKGPKDTQDIIPEGWIKLP